MKRRRRSFGFSKYRLETAGRPRRADTKLPLASSRSVVSRPIRVWMTHQCQACNIDTKAAPASFRSVVSRLPRVEVPGIQRRRLPKQEMPRSRACDTSCCGLRACNPTRQLLIYRVKRWTGLVVGDVYPAPPLSIRCVRSKPDSRRCDNVMHVQRASAVENRYVARGDG